MEGNNSRMKSIARRINSGFIWQKIKIFLDIDIIILLCSSIVILLLMMDKTPHFDGNLWDILWDKRISFSGEDYWTAKVYILDDKDMMVAHSVRHYADYVLYPFIVLKFYEFFNLLGSFAYTSNIRRKMKPLNDLAIKAQEMTELAFDPEKFDKLEAQISNYNVESKDSYIHTNDEDLHSIELAINNLIRRMQESIRQQNRFISDASHELRTPISVIQGYVNMLDRWGKEDESILDESIEALKNESDHMKELIEQLLFLARGDSGRNTLHMEEVDLNQIMREVWEESLMIDEKHNYHFDQAERLDSVIVKGDFAMLKQSMRIFVQNAAKYSAEGDTIRLAVGRNKAGKTYYLVQDEGVGMQESDVSHIFERFYRSDEARNSNTGGSGLGLSIAKWIIDAHQGSIDVLSRKDFGTRFTVTI